WGIFSDSRMDWIFSALADAHEITMRDCDSLKRTVAASPVAASLCEALRASSLLYSALLAPPAERRLQLISAPSRPAGLKQHSASATASPPSLQSCALLTRPARMSLRTAFCTAISCL